MLSRDWLAASEHHRGLQPSYLWARHSGELVGVLPCYIDPTGAHTRYQPTASLAPFVETRTPWLIGGSPAGYESGLLLANGLSNTDQTNVLSRLLEAATHLAAHAGAP